MKLDHRARYRVPKMLLGHFSFSFFFITIFRARYIFPTSSIYSPPPSLHPTPSLGATLLSGNRNFVFSVNKSLEKCISERLDFIMRLTAVTDGLMRSGAKMILIRLCLRMLEWNTVALLSKISLQKFCMYVYCIFPLLFYTGALARESF